MNARTNPTIVLTGTIIPSSPLSTYNDPSTRRIEYLRAIEFYAQFGHVIFLENSMYPLFEDAGFTRIGNVSLYSMETSESPDRGKGFQEFEMIDRWLATHGAPDRWTKVTGRYMYRNIGQLLADAECGSPLIIDQFVRSRQARTSIFCVDTRFYAAHLAGVFRLCDDASGMWIERVIYEALKSVPRSDARAFGIEPRLAGISGSTGLSIETRRWRYCVKRILRRINHFLDPHQIWYSKS